MQQNESVSPNDVNYRGSLLTCCKVFVLAQESVRRTKEWYEGRGPRG